MRAFITVALGVCTALICAACTTSSAGGGQDPAIFKVNGRDIKASELIKSPMIRQSIKQYLITDALTREAGKAGVYADEKAIDDQIQSIEQDAIKQGMTIDDYLIERQNITVDEVRQTIRVQQLFEKLVEAKAVVTDKERDDYWDQHADEVKYAYARDNHLTEAERTELTKDDVKDSLDEMIRTEKLNSTRSELFQQLIDGINLKILVISDKDEEKLYEDLMINNSKTKPEEAATEEPAGEQTEEQPGENAGEAAEQGGAAANGEAGAGADEGEKAPPAEGAGEGEGAEGSETPEAPPGTDNATGAG